MFRPFHRILSQGKCGALVILSSFLLFGCERIIDVELRELSARLVIEGNLETKQGLPDSSFQHIRLTLSGGFFDTTVRTVTTAEVIVRSAQGEQVRLHYDPLRGEYVTGSLCPRVGETYFLNITYEGDDYEAEGIALPSIPIDSLYFALQRQSTFAPEGIVPLIDFKDPAETENFYWFRLFRNDSSTFRVDRGNQFRALLRDQFINGQTLRGIPPADNEATFFPGDSAAVLLANISRGHFEFLFNLYRASPPAAFDPPPAPLRSNVRNKTTPSKAPFGFYGFIGISRRKGVTPENPTPL